MALHESSRSGDFQVVETTASKDDGHVAEALPEQRRRERVLLSILASVQFTSIVDFMVVMPLGPQLRRTLGISPFQFGMIVSCYTISAGLAGLLASSVLDRFGRKQAFLSLYCGFLVGTLLCGLPSITTACWWPGSSPARSAAFWAAWPWRSSATSSPKSGRGRATGVLMSAFALASVVGVPVCLYLGTRFGWQFPFVLLAVLGMPILFVAVRFLPPLRDHLAGPNPRSSLEANSGHVQRREPSSGLRADLRDHVRGFLHYPLHQHLPRFECRSHRI